jgi:putative ABC transport system ATP-binding protein
MMEEAAVAFTEVSKVYPGEVKALDGISLRIPRGEWVAVMGPSGSGKTTFLNLLDGLDRPTSGQVRLSGTNIAGLAPAEAAVFRRENIGLVFQQFYLIPYLTVLENVMLAQYFHSMVDERQAREMLDSVGMGHRASHLPSQLSGGEQQRACIARALVNDPGILWPTSPRETWTRRTRRRSSRSSANSTGVARPSSWSPMTASLETLRSAGSY